MVDWLVESWAALKVVCKVDEMADESVVSTVGMKAALKVVMKAALKAI